MNLEITEAGTYVIYRQCRYRRTYFQMFVGEDRALWSMEMISAFEYENQSDAFEAMMDINDRWKLRRVRRKQEIRANRLYPSRTAGRLGRRLVSTDGNA